jgi:hypothetical protein
MTTATEWISALQTMTVAGVTRHYDTPVAKVSTSDLPALFLLNFDVSAGRKTWNCDDGHNKVRTCDLIIAISPLTQGTITANYALYQSLMDAMETALDALDVMNYITYTLRTTTNQEIAEIGYWGISAKITGENT